MGNDMGRARFCDTDRPLLLETWTDGTIRPCRCGRTLRTHTSIGVVLIRHGRPVINGEWRVGDPVGDYIRALSSGDLRRSIIRASERY